MRILDPKSGNKQQVCLHLCGTGLLTRCQGLRDEIGSWIDREMNFSLSVMCVSSSSPHRRARFPDMNWRKALPIEFEGSTQTRVSRLRLVFRPRTLTGRREPRQDESRGTTPKIPQTRHWRPSTKQGRKKRGTKRRWTSRV